MKPAELYASMGILIRQARERIGLTQEELALAISLSRTSVTNIENGNQKLLVYTLFGIADALNVRIMDLIPQEPIIEPVFPNIDALIPENLSENEKDWVRAIVIESMEGNCDEK